MSAPVVAEPDARGAVDRPGVLLVDDRRENLLALEAVLAPLDVRLVSALSGEEALKALLQEEFAAILLDVQMPGMDGFETAELIRGRERTRHVPIIFVTALSKDLQHVARGYEAGAVDYVLKPFDPFVLRSKVQVFCDLERQRRERERSQARLVAERAARSQAEEIAARLQADLLPDRLPDVPGVESAAHLRSGGAVGDAGVQVGGDWYDAVTLPGGHLGIVVGDVAGRGVAAAARMAELRAVARAYALEGHPPAELVQRLNRYVLSVGAETMTTLLYAVVEPDREVVRYVSAGHVPPVLAEPGRRARFLDCGGPPLGAVDAPRYAEGLEPFGAGTVLTLYTDGLVERRAEVLDIGLERLRSAVDDCVGGSVEDARAAVLAACLGNGPAGDDVTVVCLGARDQLGSPARFVLTADPRALTALRRALRRWLAEAGADAAEAAEITLAANEAWQNAIEHGHAFASTPIAVEFALEDGVVVCTVRDRGHDGTRRSDPDRGRGIPLMRELMDELELDVGGAHGGTVVLRRRLGRRLPAAAGMDG